MCVMVGFCLKVWVILGVILYMTVIFLNDILTTINPNPTTYLKETQLPWVKVYDENWSCP